MKLTFLGNTYTAAQTASEMNTPNWTGMYRGISFSIRSSLQAQATPSHTRFYRGVQY